MTWCGAALRALSPGPIKSAAKPSGSFLKQNNNLGLHVGSGGWLHEEGLEVPIVGWDHGHSVQVIVVQETTKTCEPSEAIGFALEAGSAVSRCPQLLTSQD